MTTTMNLSGCGTVVRELTVVDTDEVGTLVMTLPGVPGIRLVEAMPDDVPSAAAAAVRVDDGSPVRLLLVTAALDATQRRRIRVECAEIEAMLTRVDPHVVEPLVDHGADAAGRPYLVLARPGPELAGQVTLDEALAAVRSAAAGLTQLAAEGLIGPVPAVYRRADTLVLGTPLPPSLEQLLPGSGDAPPEIAAGGTWTPRAQVYACAVLLSRLLTGDQGTGTPLALAGAPDVPEPVAALVLTALAPDPGRRPATPAAFAAALEAAARMRDTVVPSLPAPASHQRPLGSRYLLDAPIGRGATGHVWSARRRDDGSPVAVKLLRSELAEDPDVVTRFVRERTLLVGLSHPHLVRVHDLVAEGDVLGIVMDLVDGEDLRRLAARGRLPRDTAMALLAQTASALAAVHAAGLVHRDIKPENVLVTRRDGELIALLSDFGIARAVEGAAGTDLIGTPTYVAPELVAGRPPGPPVDVYALGVTAYELLAGHPPFAAASTEALLRAHLDQPVPRPRDVDEQTWRILSASLDKVPSARPSAVEVARQWAGLSYATDPPSIVDALDSVRRAVWRPVGRILGDDGGERTVLSARPLAVRPTPPGPPPRTRRIVLAVVAAVTVVLAGLGIGAGIAATRTSPPATAATTPAVAGQYPVATSVRLDATGTSTLTWPARAAELPGFVGFVVLDVGGDTARPLSQVLGPTVTSFQVPNMRPGRQSCYLVIAVGVQVPPPEPLVQPTCITPPSAQAS